ncbi:cytochrome c oxidase subunit 8B, mitochondrial [Cololabis saira]|uniref:cytochrome c oxidase subunit 8B, mitochondrial n=1 Tax=Cololabis saira TaxID=129043 RepID=UPI002AD40DE4|nr:cytochrome c oxidase subunit 8B, mitochondrial [Cololabis saira]
MSLPAVSRLLTRALRTRLVPAAQLSSKPAKHHISAGEQAIAMSVMFVTIMGPSGWVLIHLEEYKHHK